MFFSIYIMQESSSPEEEDKNIEESVTGDSRNLFRLKKEKDDTTIENIKNL